MRKREIVVYGRDITDSLKDMVYTIFGAMAGLMTHFWMTLQEDTVLWANLVAFFTALFLFARILKMAIDVYFDSESREMREQRKQLEKAQEEFQEERKRLDQETKRLKEVMGARTMARLLGVVDEKER